MWPPYQLNERKAPKEQGHICICALDSGFEGIVMALECDLEGTQVTIDLGPIDEGPALGSL